MSIFVSKKLNFLILKNNKYKFIFIYNNYKYFFMKIRSLILYRQSNTIVVNNKSPESIYINSSFLTIYFYLLDLFFLKKIKFKGKGYKILKRRNIIFLNFNHSHIT